MKAFGASGVDAGENDTGDTVEIRDARAISLLVNPHSRQFLMPFCGRHNTISQAAQELGLSLNLTYRWTQRLLKAGLLQATERKTFGRNLRHYRMVADAVRIQVELVPLEELLETNLYLHRQMQEAILKAFLQANELGWYYQVKLENKRMVFRTHEGQLSRNHITESDPPVMSHWFRLQLNLEQANRFSQELQALQGRFESEERLEDGQTLNYTVHIGFVPIALK